MALHQPKAIKGIPNGLSEQPFYGSIFQSLTMDTLKPFTAERKPWIPWMLFSLEIDAMAHYGTDKIAIHLVEKPQGGRIGPIRPIRPIRPSPCLLDHPHNHYPVIEQTGKPMISMNFPSYKLFWLVVSTNTYCKEHVNFCFVAISGQHKAPGRLKMYEVDIIPINIGSYKIVLYSDSDMGWWKKNPLQRYSYLKMKIQFYNTLDDTQTYSPLLSLKNRNLPSL